MFHRLTTRTRLVALAVAGCAALIAADQCTFAQATKPESKPAEAKPAGDLPKAEKLFEKARDAMGSEQDFKEIKTMHVVAKMALPEAQRAQVGDVTLEYYSGENGAYKFEQKTEMMGAMMTTGSDGKVAWVNVPFQGGYQIISGAQKERIMDQTMMVRHDMMQEMHKDALEVETVGSDDFADEEAWKVRMKDEDGNDVHAYFSKDSGRILGVTSSGRNQMGQPMDMTMRFDEWKEFGPLTLYTKMVLAQGDQEMTINFETVEINKVDSSVFELPDEVKEMAEKEPGGAGGAGGSGQGGAGGAGGR